MEAENRLCLLLPCDCPLGAGRTSRSNWVGIFIIRAGATWTTNSPGASLHPRHLDACVAAIRARLQSNLKRPQAAFATPARPHPGSAHYPTFPAKPLRYAR